MANDKKFFIRLAVDALIEVRRKYAVDKNLADMLGGPQNPCQQTVVKKYKDLTVAIAYFRGLVGLALFLLVLGFLSLACTVSASDAAQPGLHPAVGGTSGVATQTGEPSPGSHEVGSGAVVEPTEVGESYQVCNCETLNVRSSPGTDGVVVAWLQPVTRVRVVEHSGEWARLARGGWVHSAFLCPGK